MITKQTSVIEEGFGQCLRHVLVLSNIDDCPATVAELREIEAFSSMPRHHMERVIRALLKRKYIRVVDMQGGEHRIRPAKVYGTTEKGSTLAEFVRRMM